MCVQTSVYPCSLQICEIDMYICNCMCACMHVHLYVYMHIYTYICMFMYMYTCICAEDVERLRAAAADHGLLSEINLGAAIPWWWDAPPLAVNLAEAARAARDEPRMHAALIPNFEDIFVMPRPEPSGPPSRGVLPAHVRPSPHTCAPRP